jgi:hypothetical protein
VRNGALQQVVTTAPGPNAWVNDPDPITLLGDSTAWFNVSVGATMSFPAPAAVGRRLASDQPPALLTPCSGSLNQVGSRGLRLGVGELGVVVATCELRQPSPSWCRPRTVAITQR